jgi:hypothetical protein
MEQKFALRRRGVHLLGQRPERDTAFPQLVYCREQMGQRPPETVELPDHQAIARLEERQRCRKAGTIIATPARAIFEQMPLIDPRGQQRVALQVHDLPIAIGRNPHVADEHRTEIPVERFSAHYPIPTRFVVQILMLKTSTKPTDQPPVGNQVFAVISPNAIVTAMAGKSLGLLAAGPSGVPPLSAYAYQRSVSLLLARMEDHKIRKPRGKPFKAGNNANPTSAANSLLDRGYGTPRQSVDITNDTVVHVTGDDLIERLGSRVAGIRERLSEQGLLPRPH